MATVSDVALPLASMCVPVPPYGEGICASCHRPPGDGWTKCWSCNNVTTQVSQPCELVVPVSLTDVQGQLHFQLKHYKDEDDTRAPTFLRRTAALLGHFLHLHSECIAAASGGMWDVITTVPSSGARTGDHPLVRAINLVPSIRDEYAQLLRRGTGALDHNIACDDGYTTTRDVNGLRVLLIDDTFTSGARAQSAASALNIAGATVAAIVPIGRVISPEFNQETADYWRRQTKRVYDFDVCCVGDH